jgi:predicted nucleotidyltransferase
MIDLGKKYLEEVKSILSRIVPDCQVRAYGSRISGGSWKYSDLDLAIVGQEALDWSRIGALKDAFSESDLPIIVDVQDWRALNPRFRMAIEKKYEIIQEQENR